MLTTDSQTSFQFLIGFNVPDEPTSMVIVTNELRRHHQTSIRITMPAQQRFNLQTSYVWLSVLILSSIMTITLRHLQTANRYMHSTRCYRAESLVSSGMASSKELSLLIPTSHTIRTCLPQETLAHRVVKLAVDIPVGDHPANDWKHPRPGLTAATGRGLWTICQHRLDVAHD